MTQFIFPGKLSGLELYQESGQYYMRVSYESTANDGTHEITFPRVRVPFYAESQAALEIETIYHSEKQGLGQWTIYGTDKWVIEPIKKEDGTYIHYIDKLIKPSVEEIEKESEKEVRNRDPRFW